MKISKRKFLNRRAILMVAAGGFEIQQYAPANFYNWKKKSQIKYLNNRFKEWENCCDGVPGGNIIYNYSQD